MSTGKFRVTFVVSGLTPTLGLERVTLNLIKALEQHLEIRVIVIGGSDADKNLASRVEVLGPPLQGWQRLRSLARLYSCSRRSDLGTVVLVGVWTAVPWLLVAPAFASRTVVWEHTLLREKLLHSRPLRILKLMSRCLYRRADHVVAVSSPVAEDMQEYGNIRRITVIPNVVEAPAPRDIEQALVKPPIAGCHIVCVGSLTTIKAQHLALEALALLDEQYSLAVVGSGPRMTALTELAEHLGIEDRVEFTGYLDRNSVKEELHQASLLLHCSVAETFGLVYAEAADAFVPVLTVDTRVARYMVPRYSPGWISEATPEALAKAIREIHRTTPFPTEAYIEAARLRGLDFGVERIRGDWLRLLTDLSSLDARSAATTKGNP
ncbi:glycosyltransferase family 4 protein [Pseudarthrobacter sp. NamE5]|uniref:glycosyltransferase family 4 protein n=1 Tax=Pseudarthrobacter sp. NamE5 TaxID=2576839 RepID=UPI00110BC3F0|nr:glycosyltransferase family 4 protein [Pseudarthrobacter sp. NamE5]TLM81686.1 glycosyltransferase family 4 protein [Pseudarthrobacter sp. NamE5]